MSLSGKTVWVDSVIWENQHLRQDRWTGTVYESQKVVVPPGHRIGGVDRMTYDNYRSGLDSACADVVITTYRDRVPVVLAVRRSGSSFHGKWWMVGGAIYSYQPMIESLIERAENECGVTPHIEALIGFYRTCAEDSISSTTQPCYVGSISTQQLEQVHVDLNHSDWRTFTLQELDEIPPDEAHWYPMRVFRLALETMR